MVEFTAFLEPNHRKVTVMCVCPNLGHQSWFFSGSVSVSDLCVLSSDVCLFSSMISWLLHVALFASLWIRAEECFTSFSRLAVSPDDFPAQLGIKAVHKNHSVIQRLAASAVRI